jgi:hypothetical protein
MPLTGSRGLAPLAQALPLVNDLETEPWTLPGAEVLQVLYELDQRNMTDLLPPALHPTIPPTISFVVTRVAESPAGPFTLAEVRVGCRSGARPRAFLVRAACDSEAAAGELSRRWGYHVDCAGVRLKRYYDRAVATVEEHGVTTLECSLLDPEAIGAGDVQYIANMNLCRVARDGGEVTRLIQVDPDYVMHRADRGRPGLGTFVAEAWGLAGAAPVYPVSASFTVCDITLPRIRYLVDPDKPPLESVEKVPGRD